MKRHHRQDDRGRRLLREPPLAAHSAFARASSRVAAIAVVLSVAACGSDANDDASSGGLASLKPLSSATGGAAGAPGGATSSGGNAGAPSAGAGGSAGTPSPGGAAGAVASDGGTHAASSGACCSSHPDVGCKDTTVQECVCKSDPRCCSEKWDDVCVALVEGLGCGTCKTDCCTESTAPGCVDAKVESCVCAKSADCCNGAWDSFCVLLVTSSAGGAVCGQCQ